MVEWFLGCCDFPTCEKREIIKEFNGSKFENIAK